MVTLFATREYGMASNISCDYSISLKCRLEQANPVVQLTPV